MIRKAVHDDLDRIVSMGRSFHAYSPWSNVPLDSQSLREFLAKIIDSGVILLGENGMIGGIMNPLYFNPSYVVAAELFWWAESGGRELMKAFEEWGAENGAYGYQFSALHDEKSERMDALFNRAGYRKVEAGYFKEVV